jgi:hypothetical protein
MSRLVLPTEAGRSEKSFGLFEAEFSLQRSRQQWPHSQPEGTP